MGGSFCISVNMLLVIVLILAIIALVLWIVGRRPWVRR